MNGLIDSYKQKKILIAPLNWGLGHASRCVPIITQLQQNNHVFLASDGDAGLFLQQAFPHLPYFQLPGYNIKYPKNGGMALSMLWQIPKVLRAIKAEGICCEGLQKEYDFDIIISDNRYGCKTPKTHNIFISHQLQIAGPLFIEPLILKANYYFINQFNECWIPDNKEEPVLAGKLSHPRVMPSIACKYIGVLSRFAKQNVALEYEYAAIISGPEPQRTLFEKYVLESLATKAGKHVVFLGKPSLNNECYIIGNMEIYPHASTEIMQSLICKSKKVICRSGYSSIMDMFALGKQAEYIPTPGQTEQEYLAAYWQGKKN